MAATSALEARITTKELRRSAENHVTLIGSHLSSVNEVAVDFVYTCDSYTCDSVFFPVGGGNYIH